MDMGVIAALNLKYKPKLLERIASTTENRPALREEAKRLSSDSKGLDKDHDPLILDVCELIHEAWNEVSKKVVA